MFWRNAVPVDQIKGLEQGSEEFKNKTDAFRSDIKGMKTDQIEYTREYNALKRMFLLNEGLQDLEKPKYVAGIIPKDKAALKQTAYTWIKEIPFVGRAAAGDDWAYNQSFEELAGGPIPRKEI